MSFGMGLTATLAVKAEEKAIAKLSVSSTMLATTFLRASCEAQAMMVHKLVAEGRIRDMCDAGEGEYADVVDAADADYDSDVDFVDDDEIAEEICSFDARAAASDGSPALASLARVNEIAIVRKGERWMCVPPRNPLSGCRAKAGDNVAQTVLDAVRRQFSFYSAVAAWLREEGDDVLRSRAGFRDNHKGMTRKAFHEQFCKRLGIRDDTVIHAYCQSCRLSWGDASLPLESVFAPRT